MTNPELRVMTFNIRNSRAGDGPNSWENRRTLAADMIHTQRVDVVGIQEAFSEQVADLRAALPEYGAVGVGRDDGVTEGEHCLILYRTDRLRVEEQDTFWFSDTPETPGSSHWGNRNTRICTWACFEDRQAQKPFTLYNLHIDHESQPSRARSMTMLVERIRQRGNIAPVIITGDFNAREDNPALGILQSASDLALRDTFRVAHPDERVVATYHDFQGGVQGDKIDYIFASPEFSVTGSDVLRDNREGRFSSDHYPVVARLTLTRDK